MQVTKWIPLLLIGLMGAHLTAAGREVRYLTFTAKDQNGIYLRDLKEDEVRLFLDDHPVEIGYLGFQNVETAFVFLIENSPRTAQHPVSMPRWGRVNIVDQVRYHLMDGFFGPVVNTGRVLLAEFYKELNVIQDFSNEEWELELALGRMTPNHVGFDRENIPIGRFLGRGVDWLRERQEPRKILVLFTRTIDRDSYRNLEEYRQMFRLSNIELYVVCFASRLVSGPGFTFEEQMNAYFFRHLVGETGGHLYFSGDYTLVEQFINDLMSRLSNSYTVGFYVEPERERRERSVRLRVRNDRVQVAHRELLIY